MRFLSSLPPILNSQFSIVNSQLSILNSLSLYPSVLKKETSAFLFSNLCFSLCFNVMRYGLARSPDHLNHS